MKSGLRIAGIVYDCKWHQSSLIAAFTLQPFSPGCYGQLHTGGEYWRRLQGVTWGYPGKTHWASFVPILRQPNISQLFVNFSFKTFFVNSLHPDTIPYPIQPPTYSLHYIIRLRGHYLSLLLHTWCSDIYWQHSYKQSPLTQFVDLKTVCRWIGREVFFANVTIFVALIDLR